MEAEFNHLNHATWECKYHVVFTPKYRKKLLFGKIKRHLGQVFHDLARRKECRIEEGHLMPDHVHMLISIPPKYSVAQIIGYMKGKSSIWIAQNVERKMRNFLGHKFWARGYFVTTVGRDEEVIRAYIRNQELADRQLEQFERRFQQPKIQSIVQTSLKTAFGGSRSNLQLCWRLLAHQTSVRSELTKFIERRDCIAGGQRDELIASSKEVWVSADDQRIDGKLL